MEPLEFVNDHEIRQKLQKEFGRFGCIMYYKIYFYMHIIFNSLNEAKLD